MERTRDIYALTYHRDVLDKASEDERMLFLLAGHFSNDVSLLQKQLLFALAPTANSKRTERPAAALAMLMTRLLIARLVAAWELLRKDKYASLISAALNEMRAADQMDEVVVAAEKGLSLLRSEMADGGFLSTTRRKLSAHQDRKLMAEAFNRMPGDYELVDLLAEEVGNTLYGSCQDVATRALLDLTFEKDTGNAVSALGGLVASVSGAMTSYLQGYLAHFQLKYVGEERVAAALRAPISVEAPMIKSISIPFFTSLDD